MVYLQAKHFDVNGQLLAALHPDLMADGISEKHLLKDGDVLFAAKGTIVKFILDIGSISPHE